MSLDLNSLFKNVAASAGEGLQHDGAKISQQMLEILNNNKESISELIQARANGDIDQQDFDIEMEREKSILEVEMIGQEIASKAAIQKAVNAAMGTLTNAVAAVI